MQMAIDDNSLIEARIDLEHAQVDLTFGKLGARSMSTASCSFLLQIGLSRLGFGIDVAVYAGARKQLSVLPPLPLLPAATLY